MKTKKTFRAAATTLGAAVVLSAIGFAAPAQAAEACWNSEYGPQCRDFGDSATGAAKARAMDHPKFSGVLKPGATLTADRGEWAGASGYTYQWLRSGVVIPGAVTAKYKLSAADTGKTIQLRVTALGGSGFTGAKLANGVETTIASPVVAATNTATYTGKPGITGEAPVVWGTPRVGSTLEAANLGTWSPGFMQVKMQWQANGVDIAGATGSTYTPKAADFGKKITLKVTGSRSGYATVAKSNTSTAVTAGNLQGGYPVLNGSFKVGGTVTVSPGYWGEGSVTPKFTYQWLRDGVAIPGATAAAYKPVSADKGKGLTVKVTGTAAGYLAKTVLNDGGPVKVR